MIRTFLDLSGNYCLMYNIICVDHSMGRCKSTYRKIYIHAYNSFNIEAKESNVTQSIEPQAINFVMVVETAH